MRTAIQERLHQFAETLLARRGALVDWPPEADRGLALLPPPLAGELGAPEEATLSFDPQDRGLAVGLASHFLDQVAPLVESEPLVGRFKGPELYLKHADMTEPVARAFSWLNAKVVPRNAMPFDVDYHIWTFLASFRSDDQFDDLVGATVNTVSGALVHMPDPLHLPGVRTLAGPVEIAEPHYRQAARGARTEAVARAGPFMQRMEARLERDRQRLREYYGALLTGEGSPHKAGRQRHEPTPEELEARRRAVDLELRRKLAEVQERYAMNVKLEPVALASVEQRALAVECEVYRKKAVARRNVFWNPLTKTLEPMCCSRCGAATYAVAFTDDTIQPLCPVCA